MTYMMNKAVYEKHITLSSNGKQMIYNNLIVVTPKFRELMENHGKICRCCKRPFIPEPYYGENFPRATHYPTKTTCGFCIYDMGAYEHSELLLQEEYYPI